MESGNKDGSVIRLADSSKQGVLEEVEKLIGRVQKITVVALAGMLVVVMMLSAVHLGVLISEEIR
jgi:hypothetical protein